VDLSAPRLADLRRWPVSGFPNHLIFYQPTEGGIEVVRVLHGARDLATMLENEGESNSL
jgi:toxin ParE1/3/4